MKTFDIIASIANTGLSLIKDKTPNANESLLKEVTKKGIEISSKRVLNLTGTPALIGYGIQWLSECGKQDIACMKVGLLLIAGGIIYSAVLSIAQALEKRSS